VVVEQLPPTGRARLDDQLHDRRLLFLVFLAHLRTRLLAAEGGAGTLTTIVLSAGLPFVAMLFAAATARGVISYAVKSPAAEEPLSSADLLRYLPQISYVVLGFCGLLSAVLAIAVTSLLPFRTRVVGRLLAWLGLVCAAGLIVANLILIGIGAIPGPPNALTLGHLQQ
jgi:hypothetical protein